MRANNRWEGAVKVGNVAGRAARQCAPAALIGRRCVARTPRPCGAREKRPSPDRWQQFTDMLVRKGKARITVISVLKHSDQVAGEFTGDFVAVGTAARG